jgi:hypothetical protein
MEKVRGRRPYKKCLSLVVRIYELLTEEQDTQPVIDELDILKKRLNDDERAVIDRLSKSMDTTTVIEIDEADPGSKLMPSFGG